MNEYCHLCVIGKLIQEFENDSLYSRCKYCEAEFANEQQSKVNKRVRQLTGRVRELEEAMQRIHGMAERPVCTCGVKTGTAAIKLCAEKVLKEK